MIAPRVKAIRVLVADDEAPARQRLIDLLRKDTQIGTVLEASDGQAAVHIIEDEVRDLVFLDVQMPELQAISHGEFELILKDGCRSRVSRTYRGQLGKRLGQSL